MDLKIFKSQEFLDELTDVVKYRFFAGSIQKIESNNLFRGSKSTYIAVSLAFKTAVSPIIIIILIKLKPMTKSVHLKSKRGREIIVYGEFTQF